MSDVPRGKDQFEVIQGGDPMLEGFLRAAHRAENPQPIDEEAVRSFILGIEDGAILESMLFETMRLGHMGADQEDAVRRDTQTVIASIRDPEVELTPELAKRRLVFFRQIDNLLPLIKPQATEGK